MRYRKLFLFVAASLVQAVAVQDIPGQAPSSSAAIPDEPKVIDPSLAGWNEASAGQPRVGNQIRANWVMINSSRAITGRVDSSNRLSGEMSIYLLRDGLVVGQTQTDSQGNFVLADATPGVYAMVGYSPGAFFAYGFNALAYRADAHDVPRSISTTAIVSIENKQLLTKLIAEYAPRVRFRVYGQYEIGEDNVGQAGHFGWQGLSAFDIESIPATSIKSHWVRLHDGGRLIGRLHQIHNKNGRPVAIIDEEVKLIQAGQVVAESRADSLGVFEFVGIEPGYYGLVALGTDGFGAIGIEVITNPPAPLSLRKIGSPTELRLASAIELTSKQLGDSVDLALTDPESIGWMNHFVQESTYAEIMAQPLAPASAREFSNLPYDYFGYGGGPAGGFGLGETGRWLIAGGVAVLIADGINNGQQLGAPIILKSPFFQ